MSGAASVPTPSDAAAAFLSPRPTSRISGHDPMPAPRPTQRVRRRRPSKHPRAAAAAGRRLLRAAATALGALALPLFLWWHPSLHVAHAKGAASTSLADALIAALAEAHLPEPPTRP